jgi:hypothetical protein
MRRENWKSKKFGGFWVRRYGRRESPLVLEAEIWPPFSKTHVILNKCRGSFFPRDDLAFISACILLIPLLLLHLLERGVTVRKAYVN